MSKANLIAPNTNMHIVFLLSGINSSGHQGSNFGVFSSIDEAYKALEYIIGSFYPNEGYFLAYEKYCIYSRVLDRNFHEQLFLFYQEYKPDYSTKMITPI